MRALFLILCSVLLWTCQNLEDASPSSRKTFIKLYEGPYHITANDLEEVPDGYVVVGNMSVPPEGNAVDSIITVIFKTDKKGNRIGEFHTFEIQDGAATGKSIKRLANGGYIVVGDRIKRNLNPPNVPSGIIASARVLLLDENFAILDRYVKSDESANPIKADYFGGSVTISDQDDEEVIILGTYLEGVESQATEPEKPFIISLSTSGNNFTESWTKNYDLIDRNYKNSRSVHFYNNKIIWACGIARFQGDATFSYVSVPVVEPNSVFVNYSTIGEFENQLFVPGDIQPATNNAFGYGMVGSYSEPNAADGSKSNIFFMRVNASGTIMEQSVRYFDGIISKETGASLTDNAESSIIDEGQAITATSDGGFVLAGTIQSIPGTGNGGRDILLIKVNAFNELMWIKTIGGSGDEVACSITETSDRGLLICGTNTLSGAASIFLIKTDKNGELKN